MTIHDYTYMSVMWLRQKNKTKEVSELVNCPISQTNKQVNK